MFLHPSLSLYFTSSCSLVLSSVDLYVIIFSSLSSRIFNINCVGKEFVSDAAQSKVNVVDYQN